MPVSVDTATCADCLAEVDDPADRRYRYPFTNCTNCGPRYTIVLGVPYDRPATTMAGVHDVRGVPGRVRRPGRPPLPRPAERLPGVRPAADVARRADGAALAAAGDARRGRRRARASGAIVAVKGIGGYHLAVDATDADAVAELRRRKARDDKPFAVMVADLDAAPTAVRARRRRGRRR